MGQQFEEDSKTVENEGLSLLRLSEVRPQGCTSRTSVQQALIYQQKLRNPLCHNGYKGFFFYHNLSQPVLKKMILYGTTRGQHPFFAVNGTTNGTTKQHE